MSDGTNLVLLPDSSLYHAMVPVSASRSDLTSAVIQEFAPMSLPRPIYARKLFDIEWKDLFRAGCYALRPQGYDLEQAAAHQLEQLWAPSRTIVTLSVRSAFDLLLQSCAFPIGSEIIVSAVTIPHMISIIESHGLIPMPVDLHDSDTSISDRSVEVLITSRTKAILVAQLFGFRHSLLSIAEIASQHDLLLIEDCAQAFCGYGFTGSPEASVSMFSFGPIKTCTSLAGGVATVRESKILERMKTIQAGYPAQKQSVFLKRVIKYAAFKGITDSRHAYGALIWALRRSGRDHHTVIVKASHSLAANVDLLQQIRFRPSVALTDFLRYRISTFDTKSLQERRKRIDDIANRLPANIQPVGYNSASAWDLEGRHYWICPIRVRNPLLVLERLLEAGFDAAAGNASLIVTPDQYPTIRNEEKPVPLRAGEMMASIIYLPVDNKLKQHHADKLIDILVTVS